MSRRYITGLFRSEEKAAEAVEGLIEASFAARDIGALKSDGSEVQELEVKHKTGIPAGAVTGGALGAALGAVGATLVSVGAVAAPGFGLLAAGPIVAALEGALAGGAGGSIVGSVAGLGFWKEELELSDDLRRGAVLVGVPATGSRAEDARVALEKAGAERITLG